MDAWTRELAYAIGLLATDGNLSKDGRHLTVTSANPDLLDVLRASLALQAPVRQVGPRGRCYRVQWSDRCFYRWIESIGLSPAKSRSIGPLAVPDQYFADFARGFGGDGSIVVYMDRYHCGKDPRYVYKRLSTVCRLVQRHVVPTHRNPRFDLGESVRCGTALLGAALRPARIHPIVALALLRTVRSVLGAQEGTI